jgi:hypothetical protein
MIHLAARIFTSHLEIEETMVSDNFQGFPVSSNVEDGRSDPSHCAKRTRDKRDA